MSKLWVFIADNGMPTHVQKCEFCPTVNPYRGSWERVFRKGEMDELEELELKIIALQETMRPLLNKWDELRRKM